MDSEITFDNISRATSPIAPHWRVHVDLSAVRADLSRALVRDELELVYQLQFTPRRAEVLSLEAQPRWTHRTLGALVGAQFIAIAEVTGLLDRVGIWTLRRACLVARKWQRQGLPAVRTVVGLSPSQIDSGDLGRHLHRMVSETGLEPRRIGIALAEVPDQPSDSGALPLHELEALLRGAQQHAQSGEIGPADGVARDALETLELPSQLMTMPGDLWAASPQRSSPR